MLLSALARTRGAPSLALAGDSGEDGASGWVA
jgi:hypothetical protein